MQESNDSMALKKKVLQEMLELGKVMIHLDSGHEGVDVPSEHADTDLRLNLSYRFRYGDLEIDDSEIRATLSFSGKPYRCTIPFDSIFMMLSHVSREGFFFPETAIKSRTYGSLFSGVKNRDKDLGKAGKEKNLLSLVSEHNDNPDSCNGGNKAGSENRIMPFRLAGGSRKNGNSNKKDSPSEKPVQDGSERRGPFLRVIDGGLSDRNTDQN